MKTGVKPSENFFFYQFWIKKTPALPDGKADLDPIKTITSNPSCLQELWSSEAGVGGLSSDFFMYKSEYVEDKPYNKHQEVDFKWNSSPEPRRILQQSS